MEQTQKQAFLQLWEMFLTQLEGRIRQRSHGKHLTAEQLNLALRDCALDWMSEETICGRWLMEYRITEPENAALLEQILLQDMQFYPKMERKGIPSATKVVIPALGSAAGFLLSHHTGANVLVQTVSTVAPAAVLAPIMYTLESMDKNTGWNTELTAYLAQLDLYKKDIMRILTAAE